MSTLKTIPLPPGIDAPSRREPGFNQGKAWLAWSFATFFLILQMALQTSFGSMQSEIATDLQLNAENLATISAVFFITYAGLQIPMGILIDRFGVAWIIPPSACLLGVGALMLSMAHSNLVANLARLLMGIASAGSFISVMTIVNRRITPRRIGLATGLTELAFELGAIGGTIGVVALLHAVGWRANLQVMAAACLLIGICCLFTLGPRQQYAPQDQPESPPLGKTLRTVLGTPRIWKLGIIYGGFTGTMFGMSGFWNVPLQESFNRTPDEAALLTTIMLVGSMLASPLIGVVADRIQRYLPFITAGCILVFITIYPTIFRLTPDPFWVVGIQFFFMGLGLATGMLVFPLACRDLPRSSVGIATSMVNCLGLIGAGVFQFLPGIMESRDPAGGLPPLQFSLLIFLVWPVLAVGLVINLALKQHKLLKKRSDSAPG